MRHHRGVAAPPTTPDSLAPDPVVSESGSDADSEFDSESDSESGSDADPDAMTSDSVTSDAVASDAVTSDSVPSDQTPLGELYGSLSALAYVMTGARVHTRLRAEAEVSVDRAALALLRALATAPAPLRMGELAESLMVQAPHVTRQVGQLAKQGLVETVREPGDGRARRATVTQDGREAVARAEATGKQWLADALQGFSADDLHVTAAVIARIVETYRSR